MKSDKKWVNCPEISVKHDEKEQGLIIEAALPGMTRDNVSLSFGDAHFCLSGEGVDIRFNGCYQLAHEVDNHQAKAKLENGLLQIQVPFKAPLHDIAVPIG